jgi:hypothetical protein
MVDEQGKHWESLRDSQLLGNAIHDVSINGDVRQYRVSSSVAQRYNQVPRLIKDSL